MSASAATKPRAGWQRGGLPATAAGAARRLAVVASLSVLVGAAIAGGAARGVTAQGNVQLPGVAPGGPGGPGGQAVAAGAQAVGWERVGAGWQDFGRWDVIVDMAIVLVIAILLGAIIAYHPLARGKVSSIEEFEQPKTFILYAMVGAVIAQLVVVRPEMALVVFGIGGLLRFRTDVGQAKDTGRVILVTVVGMCCGLKIFVVAFLATLFGWILIYYLESRQAERVQVKGLETDAIARSAQAYREIFTAAGCRIIRERKNFLKGQTTFVFSVPRGVDRETIQHQCEALAKELRGSADWDTT